MSSSRRDRTITGLLCCAAALLVGFALAWVTHAATTRGTDYFYYYSVSKMVLAGHGGQIYDLAHLGAVERRLAAPIRVPGGVIPNVYPPSFALVVAPFAALPYAVGYSLWLAVNCVTFGCALAACIRISGLTGRSRVWLGAAAIASLPAVIALLQGQVSMLLLGLFMATFLAARAGRDGLAGVLLALTLIKPQYVVPFLILFLVLRRWRLLAALAAAAAVLTLAPAVVLGAGAMSGYAHALLQASHWGSEVGGFAPKWNRSLAGFTALLLPGGVATTVALGLDLLALGTFFRLVRGVRPLSMAYVAGMVVALLVSQHVLIHDLVLVLFPASVLIAFRRDSAFPIVPVLLGVDVLITAGFWLEPVTHVQWPTLGLVVLAAAVWACDRRREGGVDAGRRISPDASWTGVRKSPA